jgi:chaperonin GroEL (HSP60 family)
LCYSDKSGNENIFKGIDINEGIADNKEAFVWEPLLVKVNALKASTEAACTILSIDETVRTLNLSRRSSREGLRSRSQRLGVDDTCVYPVISTIIKIKP